ncbi:MAG: hypothetical protein ACT4O9_08100 [Blastocatellia bacterium]
MHRMNAVIAFSLTIVIFAATFAGGCSVEGTKVAADSKTVANPSNPVNPDSLTSTETAPKGATIEIAPNSPADTVRAFYTKLREKRFREAIFLTNMRPAVETLTDAELSDFQVDLESIAKYVPSEIEINGEIVTGEKASVTARMPDNKSDKIEQQVLQLRKENGVWVIQTVDEVTEAKIRREGKNYFYSLKIETHHDEAKSMLERVAKAQLIHSLQNQGTYAEMPMLIEQGFLPTDIETSESTGYVYAIELSPNKTSYTATATPAIYGKSGIMSYRLDLDKGKKARVSGKDVKGKPFAKMNKS